MTTERYQIYQGDCIGVMRSLADNSVDALITDPPYSSGGFGNSGSRVSTDKKYSLTGTSKKYPLFFGDTRDQMTHIIWLGEILGEGYRAVKIGGSALVFTDWRQLAATSLAVQFAGFSLRGILVWDKTRCARPNKGWFSQQAEFVIVATKDKPAGWGEGQCHDGVYSCAPLKGGKYHQTGKPIDVMKWLVAVTPKEAVILDPFMGSGSTGVAAVETGRRFIGVEMSQEYVDIARQRLALAEQGAIKAALDFCSGNQTSAA